MKTLIAAAALAATLALTTTASARPDELIARGPDSSHSKRGTCPELPAAYSGPAFAGDGDTIYAYGYPPIRIWGMNAPELRAPDKSETVPGMRARAFLVDLLAEARQQVSCQPIEWDRYCRVVAICSTAPAGSGQAKNLTLEMLKGGMAFTFWLRHPAHADLALQYTAAEVEARRQHRGLWPEWLGEK